MTQEERIAIAKQAVCATLEWRRTWLPRPVTPDELECVGSTYISDAGTSDVDILLCFPVPCVGEVVLADGWDFGGSVCEGGDHWQSWKKTVQGVEVNLLMCRTQAYIDAWLTSAEVCRFLHLLGITLPRGAVHGIHQIIMDDSTAEEELPRRGYA